LSHIGVHAVLPRVYIRGRLRSMRPFSACRPAIFIYCPPATLPTSVLKRPCVPQAEGPPPPCCRRAGGSLAVALTAPTALTRSFYSFFPPVPHSLTLYSGTMDRLVNVTKQQTARGQVSSQFSRKSCGCADPVPTLGTPSAARGQGHRPAAEQEALRSDPTHNLGMGLCLEICRTLACALATFR